MLFNSDPTSSSRRLGRVAELFHLALQCPESDRAAFLESQSNGDAHLLADVRRLIAADAASADFLVAPAIGPGFSVAVAQHPQWPAQSRQIGRYRLIRPLGTGGVGHVWLARRDDGQFDQQVAIKLIRRGMDTAAELDRFRQERQLLARVQHPNIARLIDGGATDDGLPYLAMEYVDGTPIDDYCQAHCLTVAQRLVLFREVCAAVHYAHQNLIVHRDIKPGNILVTSDGRPKLLDFGIAKVIESAFAGQSRQTLTREGRLLTPEYASPEQLRGEPVSTASDIYSLGVVLYELLTTVRPWGAESFSRAAGRDAPPQRPSSRVLRTMTRTPDEVRAWPEGDRARLARRLAGDLDTIVLKALEHDPGRRYQSVERLADDLQRYADKRPITARAPTLLYQFRRFAQRHAGGVATAGVALAAVVGALALTTRAYFLADAARRDEAAQRQLADENAAAAEAARVVAANEAERARIINAFLRDVLTTTDPALKLRPNISLRAILDDSSGALESGRSAFPPDAEIPIRLTLGRAYLGLKLPADAEPHVRRAWELQRARAIDDGAALAEVASELALCLCEQSKFTEGIPLHRRALAVQRSLRPVDEPAIMRRIWRLSTALRDNNEFVEAEQLIREALEISLRHNGERHLDTADCRFRLGFTLNHAGRPDEALPHLSAALEIQREELASAHPTVANTLLRLGQAQFNAGQRDSGIEYMRESVEIQETTSGHDHPNTVRALANLARTLANDAQTEEADVLMLDCIDRWASYYGENSAAVAGGFATLARYRLRAGDAAAAEVAGRAALEKYRVSVGPDHQASLQTQAELAATLAALERFDEAETLLRAAFNRAKSLGLTPYEQRRSTKGLINLCKLRRRAEQDPLWADCEADWRAIDAELRQAQLRGPTAAEAASDP